MKFKIKKEELTELMRVSLIAMSKETFRPVLQHIGCEIKESVLTATSVDGYMMNEIAFKVETDEQDVPTLKFVMPYIKVMKESARIITIEVTKETISFDFGCVVHSYKAFQGEFIETSKIWPATEKVFEISVDAKKLSEMLKTYKDSKYVTMTFHGDVVAFTLTDDKKKSLFLPIRRYSR